jgi:hypothetical protein
MKTLNRVLVAGSLMACLLAASSGTPQASGIKSTGDDHETKPQASAFPLDSLDGLEVQSIKEDGANPVKTKAEVATYRGHHAVRIVNDGGLRAC